MPTPTTGQAQKPVQQQKQRYVSMQQAVWLYYRVLIRQVTTPEQARDYGAAGLRLPSPSPGTMGGTSQNISAVGDLSVVDVMLDEGGRFADSVGLVFLVPVVALVFGSSVLGDIQDDGILVYLWMRPMGRGALAVGAAAAALAVTLPLTVIPIAAAGWLAAGRVDGSVDLIWAGAASAASGNDFLRLCVHAAGAAGETRHHVRHRVLALLGRDGHRVRGATPTYTISHP